MGRKKTFKIEIEGNARISNIDKHRAIVLLDDAEKTGIMSINQIRVDPGKFPNDYNPFDYRVKGTYTISLTLTKI